MRILVLLLAIVLLPLRGWMGDAMMLAPAQSVAAAQATHRMSQDMSHEGHAMPMAHASAGAAHAMDPMDHGEAPTAHAGHATCDTCQFCHSVAVTAWPEVPMPPEAPRHAPAAEPVLFASADAGQGFNPPIS